jgi:Na+/melibiose symporter-like transporter
MSLGTILIVVLVLMLVGVFPAWPHSRSWGYWPTGGLGIVVIILLVLLLLGRV